MNNEIKDLLDKLKDGNWYNELDLTRTMWIELTWKETHLLLNYINNLQEENSRLKLIIKALHKYFTEHEEYENNEFLRQLENCTENDMIWLKRVAGDDE